MEQVLEQHQIEIERNRKSWTAKPLLQELYAGFYNSIIEWMDPNISGQIVEIGSGIGQLKSRLPTAVSTDLFLNPWLDLVCDGYELPFRSHNLSHLVLFDVFHHLEAPAVFFNEARRVLVAGGRLILFEPFISRISSAVYGLFHHEPIAWHEPISDSSNLPRPRHYYAAQGNATRIFFGPAGRDLLRGWSILEAKAYASFSYLLSGGFSKPACYPHYTLPTLRQLDAYLSRWPRWFGARCLVALTSLKS
jgi:hypothetical protein